MSVTRLDGKLLTMTTQSGPPGMADLLAAHQVASGVLLATCDCGWEESPFCYEDGRNFGWHQADVLTAAGYGDTRALREFVQAAINALAAYYTLTRRLGIPESHTRHIWDHQEQERATTT